jgi:hypothetical protein
MNPVKNRSTILVFFFNFSPFRERLFHCLNSIASEIKLKHLLQDGKIEYEHCYLLHTVKLGYNEPHGTGTICSL